MYIFFKEIKFYFVHNNFVNYLILFIKNLLNLNIFKSFIHKKQIYSIGQFKTFLNPFNHDELKLINDPKNTDIDHIQSLRNFVDKDTDFYLYDLNSNILPYFLSRTLGKNVFILKKNINSSVKDKKIFFLDKKFFLKKIAKKNKINKILITHNRDNLDTNITNNFNYIFSKYEQKINKKSFNYSYFFDKYGKIHSKNKSLLKNYFLYSKIKLLNTKNTNSISAISLLKNLDIYPFDICFESVLPHVKEFILGIDSKSFNKNYELILNTFLRQTKFRKKIKLLFFDFKSETSNKCHVKARWIADVNNKLINEASSKYICYVQADELYDYSIISDFKKTILNNRDELKINFLHFFQDFNHIRNPEYAAYNYMGRLFKKNIFTSDHDGCGFKKINNQRSRSFRSNKNIFHIGYIFNYKKKISYNLDKDTGLFRNSIENFYRELKLINVNPEHKKILVNTLNKYKYLKGYHNLKRLI